MRKSLMVVVGLLMLGCSGMGADMKQSFDQEFIKSFRTSFTESCSNGGDEKQQKICACVADELIATKTPKELMGLMEQPEAAVKPLIEKCGKLVLR